MSETLQNAPIVELIAEARWVRPQEAPTHTAGAEQEAFFGSFASAIAREGYLRSERMFPINAAVPVHQAVYRFKSLGEREASSLYQVGPGVFSANAVAPYESWEAFSPIVARGLDRLIEARAPSESSAPFSSVSLRYIDLFDSRLAENRTPFEFARDVLKIDIRLPEALTKLSSENAIARPILQFQIPLKGGFLMRFSLGEGVTDGRHGIIMDMSVATTVETVANSAAVMVAFAAAHEIIDSSFKSLIEPIKHLMPPKEATQ